MPPFCVKEIVRYFAWIAIVVVAVGAIIWFVYHAQGHQNVNLQRGGNSALQQSPLPQV